VHNRSRQNAGGAEVGPPHLNITPGKTEKNGHQNENDARTPKGFVPRRFLRPFPNQPADLLRLLAGQRKLPVVLG
jgi:hypothetical protein